MLLSNFNSNFTFLFHVDNIVKVFVAFGSYLQPRVLIIILVEACSDDGHDVLEFNRVKEKDSVIPFLKADRILQLRSPKRRQF